MIISGHEDDGGRKASAFAKGWRSCLRRHLLNSLLPFGLGILVTVVTITCFWSTQAQPGDRKVLGRGDVGAHMQFHNEAANFASCGSTAPGIFEFYEHAVSSRYATPTDKVTTHAYQTMYGIYLVPLRAKARIKMLEIGLGCDMEYGPGVSSHMWRHLFPNAEIWEAEYNQSCVTKALAAGNLSHVKVLVGDQGDPVVLRDWVAQTGGGFDVIIDDGGHKNNHLQNSFDILWPTVVPGGFYFLEDLQIGRWNYMQVPGYPPMVDIIKSWVDQLVIEDNDYMKSVVDYTHPLPPNISFITCQREACVIAKGVARPGDPKIDW